MNYVERYISGEYEQVWDELLALGSAVRQDPLYADALAVAQETMRRVRKNIEELINRLIRIGFVFGYDHRLLQVLRGIPSGTNGWIDYTEVLSWVREQPPILLPANLMEEELTSVLHYGLEHDADTFRQEWRADPMNPPVMPDYLEELEQEYGPVPLSIRAWYEEVGAVNFYGYHPTWPSMEYCDPLQVCALDKRWRTHVEQVPQAGQVFAFAEDRFFKDHLSGAGAAYAFTIPNASVDARLDFWDAFPKGGRLTFVQYLRWSLLHWAGFPGMARWNTFPGWPDDAKLPQDDLAMLTRELIPF